MPLIFDDEWVDVFDDEWVLIIRLDCEFMFILHFKMQYVYTASQKWKLMIDRRILV